MAMRVAVRAVVVALTLLGAVALSGCEATPSTGSPDAAAAVGEKGQTTKKAKKAKVPRVVGLAGKQAKRKLASAGLVAFVARETPSPRPRGTVLRQLKAVGASVTPGSSVGLVLAAPYPMVPRLAGMTQAVATQRLRSAGFQVRVANETVTSGRDGAVLRLMPAGLSRVRPHSVVTMVIAHVVRPVVAPPAPSNCTPGYSPCLAPASDYDCAGGSGDGPRYTGLVRVTGADIYDLDRDGDGYGCD
jgi:hypothetical protein